MIQLGVEGDDAIICYFSFILILCQGIGVVTAWGTLAYVVPFSVGETLVGMLGVV